METRAERRAQRKADRAAMLARLAAEDAAEQEAQQRYPLFSRAASDGRCPKCGASGFEPAKLNMFGGPAWLTVEGRDVIRCITCGWKARRG